MGWWFTCVKDKKDLIHTRHMFQSTVFSSLCIMSWERGPEVYQWTWHLTINIYQKQCTTITGLFNDISTVLCT